VSEVRGEDLLTLDIGLPVRRLEACSRPRWRTVPPAPLRVDAVTRRGRRVTYELQVTPLREGAVVTGAIVVMELAESRTPTG
jgi:hypothetical protein